MSWANLKLIWKYLPKLLSLVVQIEEAAEDTVVYFKVTKAKKQIDIAFDGKPRPIGQVASELDGAFKP